MRVIKGITFLLNRTFLNRLNENAGHLKGTVTQRIPNKNFRIKIDYLVGAEPGCGNNGTRPS